MSITPRFLEELRSRLSLSEVIGKRTKVTRAGREYKACCPFHHEKTPSFTINDDKQFYHCFGCGAHGDVVGFVMRHDNLSFIDAVEKLAADAGMQVPKASAQEVKKAQRQKDLYALVEDTTKFFEAALRDPKHADALDYLRGRGINDETVAGFRLGFSPDDGQALRSYLRGIGYTDKDMLDAGVLKASNRGKEPYAFFRDRVMFPVCDRRGRVVAFGGRILPEHMRPPQRGDFKPPKYINSGETALFHKGSVLYNEPRSRMAAADGIVPVVVEGYLDVIACEQAGIRGSVAPMGTALTEAQIDVLWKMIPGDSKVPLLCFDGDNAGRKAAARVCERVLPLLKPGASVAFAFLSDGEDPDSLIRGGGADALRSFFEKPQSLFDFLWGSHIAGKVFDTPEARAGVIKALQRDVLRIEDRDVQVHYKSLMQERIEGMFFQSRGQGQRPSAGGGRDFNRSFQAKRGGGGRPAPTRAGAVLRSPGRQIQRVYPRVLLAALINHPHIYDGVEESVAHLELSDPYLRRIRDAVLGILNEEPDISREGMLGFLKNKGLMQETNDILNESVYVHASFCSPAAPAESVEEKWLTYWKDGHSLGIEHEIQAGMRRAFECSSEEEEEKLRQMLSLRSGDGA